MDVKQQIVELVATYGHEITELYIVDPANGFPSQNSRVGTVYSLRTTKNRLDYQIHVDSFEECVAEFKRQALCPSFPPAVGDGMTGGWGSDWSSYTVLKVSPTGTQVTLQADQAKQVDEYFGNQKWEISKNPNGATIVARWSENRQRYVSKGMRVSGGRRWHEDPSF